MAFAIGVADRLACLTVMSEVPVDWPSSPAEHRVVVLGASPKPARYANQTLRLLKAQGYRVVPVHPRIAEIEGLPVAHDLGDIEQPVHTLTLYVGPQRSEPMLASILALNPVRVIFNPGTESTLLQEQLEARGSECIVGCTLVMLRTAQF
jgi:predicted CoA-binding protein